MNEADIREEVVAPLLRALGYRSGTENNIARETLLRYERAFLGRKKGESDPPLTGRADYVCEVRGIARWVVEAKPPDRDISAEDVEQAHTYATHPEVRAFLFVLCNGHRLQVHETWRPAANGPILDIVYADFDREFGRLQSLLAAGSVRLAYPKITVDAGRALVEGGRSRLRIRRGTSRYIDVRTTFSMPNMPHAIAAAIQKAVDENPEIQRTVEIMEMVNHPIVGGECFRAENNQIEADVEFGVVFPEHEKVVNELGLNKVKFRTSDDRISTDSKQPTIFEGTRVQAFPAGTELFNVGLRKTEALKIAVEAATYVEAVGAASNDRFSGAMFQRVELRMVIPVLNAPLLVTMENRGVFEIEIEWM